MRSLWPILYCNHGPQQQCGCFLCIDVSVYVHMCLNDSDKVVNVLILHVLFVVCMCLCYSGEEPSEVSIVQVSKWLLVFAVCCADQASEVSIVCCMRMLLR